MNNIEIVNCISELLEEEWGIENAEFQLIVINVPEIINDTHVGYIGTAPLTLVYEKLSTHYHFLKHLNFPANDTSRSATDIGAQ